MFSKIKSQQGPEVRTFLANWLHEEVVVEGRQNPPNFRARLEAAWSSSSESCSEDLRLRFDDSRDLVFVG
jgi:hypothetical protein